MTTTRACCPTCGGPANLWDACPRCYFDPDDLPPYNEVYVVEVEIELDDHPSEEEVRW